MLDERVSQLIDLAFAEPDRDEARSALEVCKPEWSREIVRCQIAAIAASRGRLDWLHEAIETYSIDFRDLLMGAGFAEDTEKHLTWEPDW